MMRIRSVILLLAMLGGMFSCRGLCHSASAQERQQRLGGNDALEQIGNPELESCIPERFNHVYRIGDFYILGTDERPRESDRETHQGEEVVLQAVRLFGSFLDSDEDGKVDDPKLLQSLGENFAFAVGSDRRLRPVEELIERRTGRYVISMKTDIWPFFPEWEGRGFQLNGIEDSMWRPDSMNALWEECFHTITEAYCSCHEEWDFGKKSQLGRLMAKDIAAGDYDIEKQNKIEGGDYDWATAVNEYVHQIWLVNQSGQSTVLTKPQKQVLKLMQSTRGFPMKVNQNYPLDIAIRVR
jgi:hypothetical protein